MVLICYLIAWIAQVCGKYIILFSALEIILGGMLGHVVDIGKIKHVMLVFQHLLMECIMFSLVFLTFHFDISSAYLGHPTLCTS